jgi:hypothetical protein
VAVFKQGPALPAPSTTPVTSKPASLAIKKTAKAVPGDGLPKQADPFASPSPVTAKKILQSKKQGPGKI